MASRQEIIDAFDARENGRDFSPDATEQLMRQVAKDCDCTFDEVLTAIEAQMADEAFPKVQ